MRLFIELVLRKDGCGTTFRFLGPELVWLVRALEVYSQQADSLPNSGARHLYRCSVAHLLSNVHLASNQLLRALADVDLYQRDREVWTLVCGQYSRTRLCRLLSGRDLSVRIMQGIVVDNSPNTIPVTRFFKLE